MKIIIIGGLPDSLINFRGDLIKAISRENHQVIVMAANANINLVLAIESLGCQFILFL